MIALRFGSRIVSSRSFPLLTDWQHGWPRAAAVPLHDRRPRPSLQAIRQQQTVLAQLLHLEAGRRPVPSVPAAVLAPAVLSAVLAAELLTAEGGRPARSGHGVRARIRIPRQARGRGLLLRRQHVLLMLLCTSAVTTTVAAATLLQILAAVAAAGHACQSEEDCAKAQ